MNGKRGFLTKVRGLLGAPQQAVSVTQSQPHDSDAQMAADIELSDACFGRCVDRALASLAAHPDLGPAMVALMEGYPDAPLLSAASTAHFSLGEWDVRDPGAMPVHVSYSWTFLNPDDDDDLLEVPADDDRLLRVAEDILKPWFVGLARDYGAAWAAASGRPALPLGECSLEIDPTFDEDTIEFNFYGDLGIRSLGLPLGLADDYAERAL